MSDMEGGRFSDVLGSLPSYPKRLVIDLGHLMGFYEKAKAEAFYRYCQQEMGAA